MKYLFSALTLIALYMFVRFATDIGIVAILMTLICILILGFVIMRQYEEKSKLLYDAGRGIIYGSIAALCVVVLGLIGLISLFSH